MSRPICFALALAVTLLAAGGSAYAHHAFSAEFDADLPIQLKGTVTRVDWINPHSWVHLTAELEDGTTQDWMLEAGTPNTLLRAGLTKTLLLPGTEVVIRGYQSKDQLCDPLCKGSGRDITFPDGRNIFMGSSDTGAPRDGSDPTDR